MSVVPNRFLFRLTIPCHYVGKVPDLKGDDLVDLPEKCRFDSFASLEGKKDFADVRLAWNENGLAIQMVVWGKEQLPVGNGSKPNHSDGLTLWLDTRDARTSHR